MDLKRTLFTIALISLTSCTTQHKINRALSTGDTVRACELAEKAVNQESSMDGGTRYYYANCIERGFWGNPDMINAVEQYTIAARLAYEPARKKLDSMGLVVPDPDLYLARESIKAQSLGDSRKSIGNGIAIGSQVLQQQRGVTCTRWGNSVTCR